MRNSHLALLAGTAMSLILCFTASGQETVLYSEGFEASSGAFTIYDNNTPQWAWGTPSPGVGPGGAHLSSKCLGTKLDGQMPRPSDGSVLSPAIAVPQLLPNQLLRVRFWAFVSIDGMYDRGEFFISRNGTSWQSLLRMYHNMDTTPTVAPAWQKYEFTLDPSYAGGSSTSGSALAHLMRGRRSSAVEEGT